MAITLAKVGDAVTVPTSAVEGIGAATFVTVLQAGKPERVRVTVGATGPVLTQVTSGLTVGEQVVLADLSTPLPTNTNPFASRSLTAGGGGFGGARTGGGARTASGPAGGGAGAGRSGAVTTFRGGAELLDSGLMTDEVVAWYQRLLEAKPDLDDRPWCWTVIQPLTKPVTIAEVVRRLGGDPAEIEHRSGWEPHDLPMVHLNQLGPPVVMVEVMGGEGVRDEVLRWLSDGAVVHSSWWCDAIGRSSLCYAAFGQLLTRVECLDDDRPSGEQPTALDEDRAALRGNLDCPAQLALVERRTGVRLDAAWLDQPHPTMVLGKPIPDDPRPPGMFAAVDPDLAAMLLMADESTHRAALRGYSACLPTSRTSVASLRSARCSTHCHMTGRLVRTCGRNPRIDACAADGGSRRQPWGVARALAAVLPHAHRRSLRRDGHRPR